MEGFEKKQNKTKQNKTKIARKLQIQNQSNFYGFKTYLQDSFGGLFKQRNKNSVSRFIHYCDAKSII